MAMNIKKSGKKILAWLVVLCLPLIVQMTLIQKRRMESAKVAIQAHLIAKEQKEMEKKEKSNIEDVNLVDLAHGKVIPGTKFATEVHGIKVDGKRTIVVPEKEFFAFIHNMAKQKAIMERGIERIQIYQERLKRQNEKLEKLMNKTEENFNNFGQAKKQIAALDKRIKEQKERKVQNIQRMVKLYSKMPVEQSSKIFADFDDESLVELFKNMRESDLARIFPQIPPRRAAQLTLKMTGMDKKNQ